MYEPAVVIIAIDMKDLLAFDTQDTKERRASANLYTITSPIIASASGGGVDGRSQNEIEGGWFVWESRIP